MSNAPESPKRIRLTLDSNTVLAVHPDLPADRSALSSDEEALLELADGHRSVSEILRLSSLSATLTMRTLISLCERDFLQPHTTGAIRAAPAVRTMSSFVARQAAEKFSRPGLTRDLTDFIDRIAEQRRPAMPLAGEDPFANNHARSGARSTLRGLPAVAAGTASGKKPPAAPGPGSTALSPPGRPGVKSTSGEFVGLLPPPDPMLDRPTRAGAYDVVTRMAQGGVGSIYLCRRAGAQQFQHLFALKVIRQHSDAAEAAAESFMREARVSMLVTHPNILPILDFGHYQGQPFLLMEYVEGTSLGELLLEGVPCPPPLIIPVVIDVLRGLQRAHEARNAKEQPLGLVHGDVSPQNILVGTDGVARLTDFGSCRFTAGGDEPDRDATTMVKPAFMAPEQAKGDPTDARTDIFSLGVVLWTALTGRSLFGDTSYAQTVMNILRKPVPPASQYGAPAAYDEICGKALNRNQALRFASAEEMAQALIKVAAAQGLLPGDRAVGAWVQQTMNEVLLERRLHLQDVASGKTKPVVVVAEGVEEPLLAPADQPSAVPPAPPSPRGETVIIDPLRARRARPTPSGEAPLARSMPAGFSVGLIGLAARMGTLWAWLTRWRRKG